MDVRLGNRHMAVISMDNFFGKEAEKNSCKCKNGCSNRPISCFDNFWEEMKKNIAKQSTSGEAYQQEQ